MSITISLDILSILVYEECTWNDYNFWLVALHGCTCVEVIMCIGLDYNKEEVYLDSHNLDT